MSIAFTSSTDASWQELLTELTLAYSERRQTLGQSAYTPVDDKNVQPASYWATLQAWLETNCVSFIDHINGPLNPAGTAFLYFTLATWRAAAGLNASGFTRKYGTVGAMTTGYGQMEIDDAIGEWIFEDLQKGFGALGWSKRITNFATVNGARMGPPYGTGLYGSSCEEGKQRIVDNYTDWIYDSLCYQNHVGGYIISGAAYYQFFSFRNKYLPKITELPAIPRTTDLYFRLYAPSTLSQFGMEADIIEFFNWDGLPYGQTFAVLGSYAETSASEMQYSSVIGDGYSSNPVLNVSCPIVSGKYSWGSMSEDGWLLKWNFTNA